MSERDELHRRIREGDDAATVLGALDGSPLVQRLLQENDERFLESARDAVPPEELATLAREYRELTSLARILREYAVVGEASRDELRDLEKREG